MTRSMPYRSRPRRQPNLWPFSKSKAKPAPAAPRSAMTVGQSMAAAFRAGEATGDTGAFEAWLRRQGLHEHGQMLRDKLRREYERGFEAKMAREASPEGRRPQGEPSWATTRRTGAGKATFSPSCATNLAPYLGVRVCRTEDAELPFATALDPESHFATIQEAHAFIKQWKVKKNPYGGAMLIRFGLEGYVRPYGMAADGSRFTHDPRKAQRFSAAEAARQVARYDGQAVSVPWRDAIEAFDGYAQNPGSLIVGYAQNPGSLTGALRGGASAGLDAYDRIAGAPSKIARSIVGNPVPEAAALKDSSEMEARVRQYAQPRGGYGSAWSPWMYYRTLAEVNGYLGSLQQTADLRRVKFGYEVGRKERGEWTHLDADKGQVKPHTVKRGARRNPEQAADALYESFHGKPPGETVIVEEEIHAHGNLATLGVLVEFTVVTTSGYECVIETSSADDTYDEAEAKDPIYLASSEDGRQLYFVGGDQELDLDGLKIPAEWKKDDMVIGVLTNIVYRTKKKFDAFELTDYTHRLGEESGYEPLLRYDPNTPHLYVTGGAYRIEMPLVGMSAGIEN